MENGLKTEEYWNAYISRFQKFYITQSFTEDTQSYTEKIFFNPLGSIDPEGLFM